jgi:hypothetical protein
MTSTSLPHFDKTITLSDDDTCTRECSEIVKLLRPNWSDDLQFDVCFLRFISTFLFQFFSGGITNKILCVYDKAATKNTDDRLVFRIFGQKTELIIDRFVSVNVFMYVVHSFISQSNRIKELACAG